MAKSDRAISIMDGLSEAEKQALNERRREQRFPCNIDLRVASFDGVHLPERMDYVAMESRDIAKSGLSFFSPTAPESEKVVLMLGDHQDAYFVTASVVRREEGFFNRRRQYIVGCRFTGQVDYLRKPVSAR
jgi:hypothetical protein